MRTLLRAALVATTLAAAPRAFAQDDFGGGVLMGVEIPDLRVLFTDVAPAPPCPLGAPQANEGAPNLLHEAAGGFFLDRRRALGLDADQRAALAALRTDAWRRWNEHEAQIGDAESRVWALSAAEDADTTTLAQAIGQADAARTAQRVDATRALQQAVAVLTPAQRQRVLDRAR
jgi:Spy/CpxP family protein refolding chaperone